MIWRRRSRNRRGRPRIAQEHIAFIRRMSGDHPEWGEDKIAEELAAKFGIEHSASTVRRYMVPRHRPRRGDQTWRTFVRNHAKGVWACDFLTQYTAFFAVAYVFVILEIGSRRIVHDNDGIFGQCGKSVTVEENGRKRSYRCHLDRWLDEVIGIEGLPIPYGAPNASPHIERLLMRTLREEALNHFIFLTADHIYRVDAERARYYNGARPSQAIHGIPEPYPELREPPLRGGKLVARPVLGGVQHDYRLVA